MISKARKYLKCVLDLNNARNFKLIFSQILFF